MSKEPDPTLLPLIDKALGERLIPLTQVALDVVSPTRPSFLRSGEDELDGERALTCGIPTGFS
jgi:hypothetical protein